MYRGLHEKRPVHINRVSMDRKTPGELQEHVFGTYFSVRIGLSTIGIALPIVVAVAGGILHDVWLEDSISAYYHTTPRLRFFTTRDFFVGGLLAAGVCLYLYKGFSDRENVALNLAGVFAVFVALLPTTAPGSQRGLVSILHGTSAVLFFFCIAYVSLFRSRDTLHLLPPASAAQYARLYFWTGMGMIVSPLAAVVLSYTLQRGALLFWVETLGLWAFSTYWIIKTFEMRNSKAEKRALDAELRREVVGVTTPPGKADAARPGGALSEILQNLSPGHGEKERIIPADSPGTS